MVQKFGSWTAFAVAHPLVLYWIWGEPIRSIMEQVVPPGASQLTRSLLDEACPTMSALDRVLVRFAPVVVAVFSWLVRLFPVVASTDISMCLRKRFCCDRAVQAIENGARQVLVLGGGYDVLVLNLAQRYPHVLCVEVDHPYTSTYKRAAVEKLGLRPPNAHFLAIDLAATRLEDRIADECPEWDRDARSVVVAEGLFMYLRVDDLRRLLRSIKATTAPGSTLVFSYILNGFFGRLGKALLSLLGEQVMWTPPSRDEVAEVVGGEGFRVDVSPEQSNNYLQYLAKDGRLPCNRKYMDKTGIAVSL